MSLKRIALALAALLAAAGPAAAQDGRAQTGNPAVIRVDLAGGPASQALSLPRGKSAIIELPVDARDVLVTNPAVADAVLRTPRRIYVLGVASGQTDAVFFDSAGRRLLSLDIRVDQDTSAVANSINRILPRANVQVDAM
ncbi:pilus assembly protein N-terminal domain-containing protein, partial [Phenylobacterium sp.]|uniref:pilus assembly protein N-terminal domain-containing protein n=1 Tax=Phenylobacterium sp. TaxID=1871053 RepID=UPI002E32D08C